MHFNRCLAMVVCGIVGGVTLTGCGQKEDSGAAAGSSTAPPASPAAKAPPAMQEMAQRGMAQGQADGKAYAERMKAQAGKTPK